MSILFFTHELLANHDNDTNKDCNDKKVTCYFGSTIENTVHVLCEAYRKANDQQGDFR